jgi:hypothetical protein
MNAQLLHDYLLPVSLRLFPERFNSPEAHAMMIAIALQESDLKHRRQLIGQHRHWWQSLQGPATGFWQFERIGIRGVLEHRTTGAMARKVLTDFGYPDDVNTIHEAIVHNDVLAAVFARLALFRVPEPLPRRDQVDEAWRQYVTTWRPGKPHRHKWDACYEQAWRVVAG